MGVADSPLRDRVIFVQGAPRSGTSWLLMLLATHPQIAGLDTESHLFEYGVDRVFDNFEYRHPHLRGLRIYLERDELIDLVRDFCDGVFSAMRSHVSSNGEPEFVVEKTPTSFPQGSLDLQRKREVFPDAWYLHILRDGDAVTKSLMKAPFMPDRSEANCRKLWEDCVGFTRDVLGDLPRYKEVSYEEMRADPAAVGGEIFRWLGLDTSEEVLETARKLSRERFSELGAVPTEDGSASRMTRAGRRAKRVARGLLDRVESGKSTGEAHELEEKALSFFFVTALRQQDEEALRSLTTESVSLTYRSSEGDIICQGDEARETLLRLSREAFIPRLISEWWTSTPPGPREWWTRGRGRYFWPIFFSGLGSDAQRSDMAFGLTPEDGRIGAVLMLSVGPPSGRPLRELSLESSRSS
jgi:hypothetical protein